MHKWIWRKTCFFLLDCEKIFSVHPLPKKKSPVSRVIENASNWSAKSAALKFHVWRPPKSAFYLAALCCQGWLKGTLISGVLVFIFLAALCCQPAGHLGRTLDRLLVGFCGNISVVPPVTFALPQLWLCWMNPPLTDLITLSHGSSSALSLPGSSLCDHRHGWAETVWLFNPFFAPRFCNTVRFYDF